MGEEALAAQLEANPPVLRQWPSKDRQQLWATLWLALHFVPNRLYHETEVDWMIARHHAPFQEPDCPMIRKDLERRGFVERLPGGGGFCLLSEGVKSAIRAFC